MKTKNINKNWILLISILSAIVFLLSISLLVLTLQRYSTQQTAAPSSQSANTTPASAQTSEPEDSSQQSEDLYLVKTYNGKIGIFLNGEESPFQILDIDPTVLPEKDQEELQEGIKVKGADNLRQLIEDFDG